MAGNFRTSRTPASPCPHCGRRHDAATDPTGDAVPKPGDISVCIQCGGISLFDRRRRLRKPNAGELAELANDPELAPLAARLQRIARAMG